MKEGQRLWSRNELILAINLYCKLPFGKMHSGNLQIIELSKLIDRSPSAVARKLGNFASLDPTLKQRNIKGLPNTGELTEQIWKEFYDNWDEAVIESERLLAKFKHTSVEELNEVNFSDIKKEGLDVKRLVNIRVNQCIFRKMILAAYRNSCCITGINHTDLLVASHIIPWHKDKKNRLNPTNGLCLNALHDRAFDKGLITVLASDYRIKVSSKLKKRSIKAFEEFIKLDGKQIQLPDKFLPSRTFLKQHNNEIFDS